VFGRGKLSERDHLEDLDVDGGKGKSIPVGLLALSGSEDSMRLRLPEFLHKRHMKAARLLALRTGRIYCTWEDNIKVELK
jgi:hypothetical protein